MVEENKQKINRAFSFITDRKLWYWKTQNHAHLVFKKKRNEEGKSFFLSVFPEELELKVVVVIVDYTK